jgi:hypothetical protein
MVSRVWSSFVHIDSLLISVVTGRTGRVSESGDSLLAEETASEETDSEETASEETAGGDCELQVREARPMYVVASS